MTGHLRVARANDAEAISAIYAPYVMNTCVTFETVPPTPAEFVRRIEETLAGYPYLVWEEDGRILGYAYAHRYAERAAYGWAAEASIYLAPEAHGSGAARKLYGALMEILRQMNCIHLYAKVAHPNPRSEAFHRLAGFKQTAFLEDIGFKHGRWIGLTYYHLLLNPKSDNPAPVIPFTQMDSSKIAVILDHFTT